MLIGYIRPHKRRPENGQRSALEAVGCDRVWVESKDETLDACVKQLRRGDVLAVLELWLLAEPRSKEVRAPRRTLWAAVQAVEARGASMLETSSGRSTKRERDAMMSDAIDWLSGAARGRKGAVNGRGRQPKVFAPEVVAAAERVWRDRRVKTWSAAAERLPKGFTVYRAFKLWGQRDGE